MGQLIRDHDWAKTPLGPIDSWPTALRIAVTAALDSSLPSILLWGRELIQVYNDAYRPLLDLRHPRALGQRTEECWPEVHDFNAPLYDLIFKTGKCIYFEDQEYVIKSSGNSASRWFTISYGPIRDATSTICGVLVTAIETTRRVCAERETDVLLKSTRNRVDQLYQMFNKAPNFMAFLKGSDHVFEMVNDAYHHLMKNPDLHGKKLIEAFPDAGANGLLKQLDEAYQTGKPFVTSNIPFFLKNQEESIPTLRYLNFIYQPLKDENGDVTGIFVEGIDVTEKAKADSAIADAHQYLIERIMIEEALYLEKMRADITLNSISDAVIGTDISGNVNYLNAAAERITGWSRDEARGRPINDIMHLANA
ncbi:MAG TPA: PAS domain-containing protein, partial [Burkholderiales bacterium]|nr:PAS domain-containing protein [Burkholderiales bacterium]